MKNFFRTLKRKFVRQNWWLVVLESERSYNSYRRYSGFLGVRRGRLTLEDIWRLAKKENAPQSAKVVNIQFLGRCSEETFRGKSVELIEKLSKI